MTQIAYIDCFAGIAGDMFLGAIVQAGVPVDVLNDAVAALKIGAGLKVEAVDRSGISALKVHVLEAGKPAGMASGSSHSHDHTNEAEHQHNSHDHDSHRHPHVHGRSLTVIREIIRSAHLDEAVKATAVQIFELLGQSEAKIHNVPVDSIHFHEVGAVDAIVDIVGASAAIHYLQIDSWYCSPVNVGSGMVECAHGTFPVPAPATADLLRGFPTYSAHVEKELVTPTGAAVLRVLAPSFGPQPPMLVESIGYGAGARNPPGFPNVLRLSVGERQQPGTSATSAVTPLGAASTADRDGEVIIVLETAIDDLSPQVMAYAAEQALAAGALDVMLTPVLMKKGRPGTLLTVLCHPAESQALQSLLFRETSTLGIRVRQDRRFTLERQQLVVQTAYGNVRVKVASSHGERRNVAPEFEDCRAAAERCGVPLKVVQQAALAAFRAAE